jgi:hypothetical protein
MATRDPRTGNLISDPDATAQLLQRRREMDLQANIAQENTRRFNQVFAPGGQFGRGTGEAIERGGQQAISAGQLDLASTGMSSGTNVAGLRARVLADTALARAGVEDTRISNLSQALTAAGQAKIQQQQIAADLARSFTSSLASLS